MSGKALWKRCKLSKIYRENLSSNFVCTVSIFYKCAGGDYKREIERFLQVLFIIFTK